MDVVYQEGPVRKSEKDCVMVKSSQDREQETLLYGQ